MKNKILTVLLLAGAGFGQDAQAMGGAGKFTQSLMKSTAASSLIAGSAAYGVQAAKDRYDDKQSYNEALAVEKEFTPEWLTPERRLKIEKRFTKFKPCTRLIFNQHAKGQGSAATRSFRDGSAVIFFQEGFTEKNSPQVQSGIIAHESCHFESCHTDAILERRRVSLALTCALVARFNRISLAGAVCVNGAYQLSERLLFRPQHEVQADKDTKTFEELLGGFLGSGGTRYSSYEPLKMDLRSVYERKKHLFYNGPHATREEQRFYLMEQMKKQIENPQSHDIPSTPEEIREILLMFFGTFEELRKFVKEMDKDAVWEKYFPQPSLVLELLKKRIFFLIDFYEEKFPEDFRILIEKNESYHNEE
jgi:hypothetical protein